jgi:hypothetical protein
LQDNSFWELVIRNRQSKKNQKDKNKETVPLLAYKEELQSIFFSLKDLDTVECQVDMEDEEKEGDEDKRIDDNADSPIENEEERRADLKKLSQVKKYEILLLALKDLDVAGHAMLASDLKEKRQKQRDEQKKRIAQIHEAVDYFQS